MFHSFNSANPHRFHTKPYCLASRLKTLCFAAIALLFCFPATSSAQADAGQVLQKATLVNDWFMAQWPDPTKDTFVRNKVRPSSLWTRAVYYEGLMALHTIQPEQRYLDYTLTWCNYHKWTPRNGVKTHDADDYCCCQTYIDMYRKLGADPNRRILLQPTIECLDNTLARGKESDADWWWIDAIQMGMPAFQKLAKETGVQTYAEKAWSMYEYTRNQQDGGLRNPKDALWWRDRDFNPPYKTPGGKECYWSRGDGWVVAALVRVLDEMQPNEAHYNDYLGDLTSMLESLIPLQRKDGFWNCSLADENDFGGPEVTGTSLFLYGMAWCVNHGYLPKEKYAPVMQRAWDAMASCVHPDGFLGWQQGTGKQPSDSQPVTFNKLPDFDDYGVGCFLLGATEYYKLMAKGSTPALSNKGGSLQSIKGANDNSSHLTKTEAHSLKGGRGESLPGIRWWWPGSAVTTTDIWWNLTQFASRGIGAVEITPIYGVQGNEANDIPFLSPKWMEMLRACQQAGNNLGIQIDMNCGTGWPFGGPDVPLEEAACKLVVVDVLTDAKTGQLDDKAFEKAKNMTLIARREYKEKKGMKRIIALYQDRTRQKVKRAAPGGEGYVIDHFDSTAVRHYLENIEKAFEQTGTPYPATFFNDSYEVYEADWTPSLLQEFKARRGYDLLDKLKEFVDGDAKVIADYRETLSDLLLQNFTRQWVAWCHKHGVKVRNQAHGSPANLIDVYASVDIPEIEGFGLSELGIKGLRTDPGKTKKNDSDLSMLKYAASAAHVTGKRYASSETFTWLTEHFRTSLSQMKPDLDLMFCAGVNRMYFHGACYSPQNDPWPGWRFYASVDMSPNNSIWRDAKSLTDYITLCQSRLQDGEPDNDFIVLLPVRNMWKENTEKRLLQFDIHSMGKKAPEFIASILKIDSLGYDCDYISEALLLSTTLVDGMLQTQAGTRYKGLIIPGIKTIMTKQLRKHIDALHKQGAHIIYDIDATELAKAAKPESIKTKYGMKMIRRKMGSATQYFVANLTPADLRESVQLSVMQQPLMLDLRSGESCFIHVDDAGKASISYPLPRIESNGKQLIADLTTQSWRLSFTESTPDVQQTFRLNKIQTWETLPNDTLKELMGTGIYETVFTLPEGTDMQGNFRLDLGDVRESARIYLNGRYVGTTWAHPMTIDFPGWMLQKEKNALCIEVTNLPANRIAAYDKREIPWRKFKEINVVDINYKKTTYADWSPMPSGLNSSVMLYQLK